MIEFPCTCGHRFRLADDQAGAMAQCPACKRLVDVPTLADLSGMADDGTYRVDATPARDPHIAAELAYVYQKGHRDAEGQEIDLRLSDDEIRAIDSREPIPLAPDRDPREHAPKYDPVSGELIAPFELKDEPGEPRPDPASIPVATAVISYASGQAARRPLLTGPVARLLSPANLAVMIAVFFMHVIIWPVLFVSFAGIFFFVVSIPVMTALIIAHYGNVIEEAGPFENDELPRPLRNLGWYEDIYAPFCNVFASLMICYGPVLLVIVATAMVPRLIYLSGLLIVALVALGTFLTPAVVMTLQCGGTIHNLRPDRLMSVINTCGAGYFAAVVLWVVGGGAYALGWIGTTLAVAAAARPVFLPDWLMAWAIVLPALVAGIFLTHWLCLWLAQLYRTHFEAFPWVLQRHISTRPRIRPPSAAPPAPPADHTGPAPAASRRATAPRARRNP